MEIKNISLHDLKEMNGREGLILQGCGGDLQEWVDGVNDMLTESGILWNGSRFEKAYTFKNEELTCLLFPFDDVQLDVGKLAIWRLETRENFGSTWLSDYVPNNLGGFIEEQIEDSEIPKNKRPKCPIIGADGNIFNIMGIASRTLRRNDVDVDIKGFFDNVNHSKLIRQMWAMGIRDKKLICIIKEMLRAPIILPSF